MIVEMARIRLLGPREDLPAVLESLQDVGLVHLVDARDIPGLEPVKPTASEARRRRALLRGIDDVEAAEAGMGRFGARLPQGAPRAELALPLQVRSARRIRRKVEFLGVRERELHEERALLLRYRELFGGFESLLPGDGEKSDRSAFLVLLRRGVRALERNATRALSSLLGDDFLLRTRELDSGETAALLLVPAARAPAVERLLADARIETIPIPASLGAIPVAEALPRLKERLSAVSRELAALRREVRALARQEGSDLAASRARFHDCVDLLSSVERAGRTAHAFVVDGWVPADGLSAVARRLAVSHPEVVFEVRTREQWAGEAGPVVLHNPRLFRPFEMVTRLLPLPRYGTIDPTPYVAVFFPMFFGVVLGDVGYAAVLLLGAALLRLRAPPGSARRNVASIATACAAFALAFGLLYGEFFGDLGRRWFGLRPLWFDRGEAFLPFLALALSLGAVHLIVGLLLGVISSARLRPREALGRGITLLMVLLVIAALLAVARVLPAGFFTPAVVILLLAFPALIAAEGIIAPIELLSTLGHILSYARVMALGTASVMLAVIANRMVGAIGSAVVGALFALLFHLVNFGIGLFSPTIHVLRLHYVEFFGTFYSPGGIPYHPLGHFGGAPALPA